MGEQKIARTVAEAQVGDLLWVNVDRWRKTPWVLWPVRKVGRLYAHVGPTDSEGSWVRIHREQPYDNNRIIAGWQERELQEWRRLADTIAEKVRRCSDVEALKTVAFALGIEGPPNFSTPALNREDADRGENSYLSRLRRDRAHGLDLRRPVGRRGKTGRALRLQRRGRCPDAEGARLSCGEASRHHG